MLLPRIVFISHKKRLFDVPNSRSSHSTQVPRLGGLSFMPSLFLSVLIVLGLRLMFGYDINTFLVPDLLQEQAFFASGMIVMFLIGVADDLTGVSFKQKFIYQIITTALIIQGGVYVDNFHHLFGLTEMHPLLGGILTVLLVVFVINAINLIDGIDGLASGLSFIPLIFFTYWFTVNHLYIYSMACIAFIGTLIPFFYCNVFSMEFKLFMGDTGSLILGYTIAFMSAKFCMLNVDANEHGVIGAPVIILSLLFIPLFDACRVFLIRIIKKRSPFSPDRSHIHHKLLDLGFSHRQTMCIIITFAFAIALVNYLLIPIIGPTVMLCIDITLWVILMSVIHHIGLRLKNRMKRAIKKNEEREVVKIIDTIIKD
jgi:UDP-N-acetylmuramyl pentapeptide phosphotransferase/UDP-N-acetylglucosamine-1-phosphate transferase